MAKSMKYNEKAVEAIEPFNVRRKQLEIDFMTQRQFNGIVNALTMVVEEPGWDQDVFDPLCDAVRNLINKLPPKITNELEPLFNDCVSEVQKYP